MQPKIYSFKEHEISSKNIDSHVFEIIEKLKKNGFTSYLVGGSVRDLLLKQVPKDFDISTQATPEEIKKLFRNCILIGKRFRLAHIRFGSKVYEVSTFRRGDISTSELILRDNEWGSEVDDAIRRDFTINGLFYDTETQNIIDYVGGVEDAKKKILRVIGDPTIRFLQDPVRMIRLLKFKARFDFNIDEETLKALDKCKDEITKSSQARILEELFRMLQSGSAERFFSLLHEYGLLNRLLPKVSNNFTQTDAILKLLKQADIYICKHSNDLLERPILASCLVFPILENTISHHPFAHLGAIAEEASKLITGIFSPFFLLPRKLKQMMMSILINQFRFTPHAKTRPRLRIPRDQFFPLALKFLKLRCMDKSELLSTYSLWHEYLINAHRRYHHRNPKGSHGKI